MSTMTRQGYNPMWNQLQQFQGELNRLFDRSNDDGGRTTGMANFPAINVWRRRQFANRGGIAQV